MTDAEKVLRFAEFQAQRNPRSTRSQIVRMLKVAVEALSYGSPINRAALRRMAEIAEGK